jgi:methionyl-tRNA formyltransferase
VRLGRAWTTFRGRRLRILQAAGPAPLSLPSGDVPLASRYGADTAALRPGSLVGDEVVAAGGSRVRLITVQPEGKRAMPAGDWLHGAQPAPDERLGT